LFEGGGPLEGVVFSVVEGNVDELEIRVFGNDGVVGLR
jgi:hypothetical protein